MTRPSKPALVDRVAALRGQVLAGDEGGERETPGSEVFDAVLRILSRGAGDADRVLQDGIARRLAWRDSELRVLTDAGEVCRRLLAAAHRALRDPDEEMEVAQAVAEAGSAAARILIHLLVGRLARERAALLREQLSSERLGQALDRQKEELSRLERARGG
jgi:hypothetical protein